MLMVDKGLHRVVAAVLLGEAEAGLVHSTCWARALGEASCFLVIPSSGHRVL